jgi:DNA-binding GntR family transcriptional regulator
MVFGIFRGGVAADEHKALLTHALNRDAAAAQDVLTQHIQGCVDFAIQNRLLG